MRGYSGPRSRCGQRYALACGGPAGGRAGFGSTGGRGRGWRRTVRSVLVGGLILIVGDRLEPGGAVAFSGAFEHGEVAHEVALGSAVPVLLARRRVDGVAGAHADDGAVAGRDEADAVGDVQRLADGMGVPVGAGAGGEADEADDHPGRVLAAVDGVDVHVAGEA